MVRELPIEVHNRAGDPVRGDLRYVEGTGRLPVLLVCHGFTAHKDWGPFPYFGSRLAKLGFASLVFNFSHNGVGKNSVRLTEKEKFAHNTVGKELDDVCGMLDALAGGEIGNGVADVDRIGIIGHSRGGGIAILSGRREPRIKGVATWAGVGTFFRYTEHQKRAWEEQGYLPVTIRGTKTALRYDREVLRDLEDHRAEYDLQKAVENLRIPLLIVHGAEDVAVKRSEPDSLYALADKTRTQYVVLEGVGHAFGAGHPFQGNNAAVDHVVDLTARWFHRFLSRRSDQ